MQTLTNIWNLLDGKKTVIAAAIFTLTFFLTQFEKGVLIDIWGVNMPVAFDKTLQSLDWIASILGGAGLIHKAVKP